MPPDGVIVLTWGCAQACTLAEVANDITVFEVSDEANPSSETDKPVAGSIERRGLTDAWGGWALWRPEQPLVVGRTYSVATSSMFAPKLMVNVVRQLGFDPRGLLPVAQVQTVEHPDGDRVCCDATSRSSCGDPYCFQPRLKSRVLLSLDYGPRPFGRDQWLYRTTFRAGEHPPHVIESRPEPPSQFLFDEVASEYCYKLEGERIADGELVPIAEECLPAHIESLPTRPLSKLELAQQLIGCPKAPDGYESAWKEANRTIEAAEDADGDPTSRGAADADSDGLQSATEATDGGCRIGDSRSALGELCGALIFLALAARKRHS